MLTGRSNVARGLFRFWLVATIPWILFWCYALGFNCLVSLDPVMCRPGGFSTPGSPEMNGALLTIFGVPLFMFIVGAAATWAARGFRPKS